MKTIVVLMLGLLVTGLNGETEAERSARNARERAAQYAYRVQEYERQRAIIARANSKRLLASRGSQGSAGSVDHQADRERAAARAEAERQREYQEREELREFMRDTLPR